MTAKPAVAFGAVTRPALPFSIMMVDERRNWAQVPGGESVRKAFRKLHGYAPGRRALIYICHPLTRWDGLGGYSIPQGEWSPILISGRGAL